MTRTTGVPLDLINVLQSLVIFFVAVPMFARLLKRRGYKWRHSLTS